MTRILVVDDEKSIRVTLREFLKEAGYHVETAEDAQAALGLLECGNFDIVVTDIVLPRMSGMTLLQRIHEVSPNVLVVLMTGEPTVETASEAVRSAAFEYLFKPVSKETILRVVAAGKVVKSLRDEKRQLQEQNRRYQEHLEELVEARTGALKTSEAKYRTLYESSTDAILIMSENLQISGANPAALRMFGCAGISEIASRALADLLPASQPDGKPSLEMVRDAAKKAIEAGAFSDEWVHKVLEGKEFWSAVVITRMEVEGHAALQMSLRDITEQKEAQRELLRLKRAVESAAEVIMVTAPDGTIQYVNPAFTEVTGFTPGEAVGKKPNILKSGKQDRAFYEALWATLLAGETWSGRLVNMKKNGGLYTEEATISPVLDSKSKILNFVAVKRDITEQLDADRRLQQAQKLEALGTLAGGIAHDFNNVLAAIIGYGQMASEEAAEDSEARSDVEHMLAAAQRAKDLVRQILTFSRQGEEQRRPVKIHLIVGEALRLLRPGLPSTIDIREDIDKNCRPVFADPTQIHQVVMNLCTNAYYAMRESGGVLEVSLTEVKVNGSGFRTNLALADGAYAKLSITDTGCGMDADTLDRMYDPFFTTKAPGEGTGLGLATVHGIISRQGGAIDVDTRPGAGTRFDIYLPCHEDSAEIDPPRPGTPIRGRGETIMVVDDEANLVEMLSRELGRLGYSTVPVVSSLKAIDLFRAHPEIYDMIITDQTMPKVTGEALAREVLRIRPEIPIIMLSGWSKPEVQEEARKLGVRSFISKPFDLGVITHEIRALLDSCQGRGPEAHAQGTSMESTREGHFHGQ